MDQKIVKLACFIKTIVTIVYVVPLIAMTETKFIDENIDPTVGAWDLLIPDGVYDFISEDVTFEMTMTQEFQDKINIAGESLNYDINGTEISIVGFMVPLDLNSLGVISFLLVPEAGQCIHVPPPPANQTILSTLLRISV